MAIVANAPYRSIDDLARRAQLRAGHLEALTAAGALDAFGSSRRDLLWRAGPAAASTADRLPGVFAIDSSPALAEPTAFEVLADDLWALGLSTEHSALALLRDHLRAEGVLTADALRGAEAQRVSVAGVVTHRQRPESARGAVFLNLEDETGHVNVIFSLGAWDRWREVAANAPALIIRGTITRGQGSLALVAEHVRPLTLSGVVAPARDWA
jgi:error-prone DNA polymerase